MTMFGLATIAILVSTIPIVMLCLGDPKRRRTAGRKDDEMPAARRRLLAAAACLPGIVCALLGDSAAFMMWLGGCALLGWALAAAFQKAPS